MLVSCELAFVASPEGQDWPAKRCVLRLSFADEAGVERLHPFALGWIWGGPLRALDRGPQTKAVDHRRRLHSKTLEAPQGAPATIPESC